MLLSLISITINVIPIGNIGPIAVSSPGASIGITSFSVS